MPGDRGAPAALLAEFLITFLLMVTIMATVLDDRSPGPLAPGLAVGLMVAAGIFATLPVSGGSFNPARTLGPMLVSMQFDGWWIYLVGPIAGAVAGALFYAHVLRPGAAPEQGGPGTVRCPARRSGTGWRPGRGDMRGRDGVRPPGEQRHLPRLGPP